MEWCLPRLNNQIIIIDWLLVQSLLQTFVPSMSMRLRWPAVASNIALHCHLKLAVIGSENPYHYMTCSQLLCLLFHSSAQHRYDQISLMSKCLIISDRYQDGLVSSLTYIYVYWSHLRNIFTFFDKHPTNTEKKLPAKCYVNILQWIYIWSMKYLLC